MGVDRIDRDQMDIATSFYIFKECIKIVLGYKLNEDFHKIETKYCNCTISFQSNVIVMTIITV